MENGIVADAKAVLLKIGIQDTAGAETGPIIPCIAQNRRPLQEPGIHFHKILPTIQTERRPKAGISIIKFQGGRAQRGNARKIKNKGLRRMFQSQRQHLFYHVICRNTEIAALLTRLLFIVCRTPWEVPASLLWQRCRSTGFGIIGRSVELTRALLLKEGEFAFANS